MLLKNDVVFNDCGFAIKYFSTQSSDMSIHNYYELIYVLEGSVKLKCTAFTYDLNAGDVFMVNVKELHKFMTGSKDNRVLILHIDPYVFNNDYPRFEQYLFVCNSPDKTRNVDSIPILRQAMMDLTRRSISPDAADEDLHDGIMEVIRILVDNFRDFSLSVGGYRSNGSARLSEEKLDRLNEIQMFIYQNAGEKISLDELADKLHLNRYYVSHFVRQTIGLSMSDFLNLTRVELSEAMLINNELSIEQISYECGFSARRYYEKHFKRWYGITPAEYRNNYTEDSPEQCVYYPVASLFHDQDESTAADLKSDRAQTSTVPSGILCNTIRINSPLAFMNSLTVTRLSEIVHLLNLDEAEVMNVFPQEAPSESDNLIILQLFEALHKCRITSTIVIDTEDFSAKKMRYASQLFKSLKYRLDDPDLSGIKVLLTCSDMSPQNLLIMSSTLKSLRRILPNSSVTVGSLQSKC